MQSVKQMFITRASRLVAASQALQIMYESYDRMHSERSENLVRLFGQASSCLSEHYLDFQSIKEDNYKIIAFSCGQLLISIISEVESYLSDVMTNILIRHPGKISKMNVEFSTVVALGSYDSLIEHAARRRCVEIMYKTPNEYKKEFLDILSAASNLLDENWPKYVEAKARRDLGVHNDWAINDIYRNKAGGLAQNLRDGAFLVPSLEYVLSCRDNCVSLMEKILEHSETKLKI